MRAYKLTVVGGETKINMRLQRPPNGFATKIYLVGLCIFVTLNLKLNQDFFDA